MPREFQPGDLVHLKTGGPTMTVASTTADGLVGEPEGIAVMADTTDLPFWLVRNCLDWVWGEYRDSVCSPLETTFPHHELPSHVASITCALEKLNTYFNGLSGARGPGDLGARLQIIPVNRLDQGEAGLAAVFKTIVLRYRRFLAARTEILSSQTFHPELLTTIRRELVSLDRVVQSDWFQKTTAASLPSLRDYLPMQSIEERLSKEGLPERVYDEKFHTLLSPTLFLRDLNYYRRRCDMRRTSVAVAFLDIDDFRSLNKAHSEVVVDTNLLPIFMQRLEAQVYAKGHAYRQGGDEYLVTLPSVSTEMAVLFFDELRQGLASLEYLEIPERTTVSIGLCVDGPESPFTDQEVMSRANAAKQFAKDSGKNRIASFTDAALSIKGLKIVRPLPS
jgi:diguanylate cyclase (GGDEF)-like protein